MTDLSLWRRLQHYAAAGDELTAASNKLALILASNQPFYPLYVRWVTGEAHPLLALTLLSTPFFLASPWIARRFPTNGRLWFPTIGALNTFFCSFLFGAASGVDLFLAPCLVIGVLSSRPSEWRSLALYVAGLAVTFLLMHQRSEASIYPATQAQFEALHSLNAYSAAALSVIAAWMLCGARRESVSITGPRRAVTGKGGGGSNESAPGEVEQGHEDRPVT